LARRSLKPQLNQIRTWVRQGRTDAWIAHQLDVSVGDIRSFKREHELAPVDAPDADGEPGGPGAEQEEPDLRAEDDALVAAALEAERQAAEDATVDEVSDEEDEEDEDEDDDEKPRRRRRGRRGGRTRRRRSKALEGTFDHGDEGYGLWLDPAVQDDPVYAEHWAGHRPVSVVVEPERIVITRAGEEPDDDD
jgi:nitric oxide reductase activation protein